MSPRVLDPGNPKDQLALLAQQCGEDSAKWFPAAGNLGHIALALCGEAGEIANLVKKIDRGDFNEAMAKAGGLPPHLRYELAMEIADVFTYILCLADLLKIDLQRTYEAKRAENIIRFGKTNNAHAAE
jgi:NTP pyrophosphatase (non-canonical NTP hydrolase)